MHQLYTGGSFDGQWAVCLERVSLVLLDFWSYDMDADISTFKEGYVRELGLGDLGQLKRVAAESDVFKESEIYDAMNMIEYYVRFPESDELVTYVYTIGNEIVGFVSFGLGLGNKTYELYWLCVSLAYQGRGIGSKLLKFAEEHISLSGGRVVFIETSSTKKYEGARIFYERMGYAPSASIKDYFDDGDDKIIYSKRLHSSKILITGQSHLT